MGEGRDLGEPQGTTALCPSSRKGSKPVLEVRVRLPHPLPAARCPAL